MTIIKLQVLGAQLKKSVQSNVTKFGERIILTIQIRLLHKEMILKYIYFCHQLEYGTVYAVDRLR